MTMTRIASPKTRSWRYSARLIRFMVLAWVLTAMRLDAASFKNLSQRLPSHANTIVMVNVEKIMASPIAQREGWRENHERHHEAGLTIVPPACDRFLLASNMDLEFFQTTWESAIAEVHYEPSIPDIAVNHGGSVDEVEGRDAAVLPDDTYVVKFGPKLIGAMSPANRQSVTRWLKHIYSPGEKSQSEYITEAMGFADKVGTPVIMAIDFENAFSQKLIRGRLDSLQAMAGKEVDLDQMAKLLSSMRGVTLGITIKERAFGKLKIDFNHDVTLDPETAKMLLLEILAYRGAMIDEFNDWTPKVNGKQFSIEGPFLASGMRRVFSVLEAPAAMQQVVAKAKEQSPEETAQSLMVASSQQYFKSTQHLLDDLKEKKPNGGFKTSGQIGMWYEKYATKIDRLPMSNVDPELLNYGGFVSSSLRQAQGSMRSIGARKRVRQADANVAAPIGQVTNTWAGGGSRWGRWGGYGGGWGAGWSGHYYSPSEQRQVQQRERTAISTQERVRGYGEANSVMQDVANATSDIRRTMSEKYNVNF
jgi:hypothetical protein